MENARPTIGILIIIIGLSLLIGIPLLQILFPILLIFIGLKIIFGRGRRWQMLKERQLKEDTINQVIVFQSARHKVVSDRFRGGEQVTVFGASEIDLLDAKVADKTVEMELVAVFGSINLTVPKSWAVASTGAGVAGSFDNRTNPSSKTTTTLKIKGAAVLGSVEITN